MTTEQGHPDGTTPRATTLLDEVIPEFHFGNRHARRVEASPERVADALDAFRIGGIASLLFKVRGIRLPSGSMREVLTRTGFTVLAEEPGREVVAGTFGRFWAIREQANMEAPADVDAFRSFDRPGWAHAAISVRIEPLEDGSSLLETETRVRCVDEVSRRRFAAYWALISTFSGWLRRDFLRKIAEAAERSP